MLLADLRQNTQQRQFCVFDGERIINTWRAAIQPEGSTRATTSSLPGLPPLHGPLVNLKAADNRTP
jgi:hypothetical protein